MDTNLIRNSQSKAKRYQRKLCNQVVCLENKTSSVVMMPSSESKMKKDVNTKMKTLLCQFLKIKVITRK